MDRLSICSSCLRSVWASYVFGRLYAETFFSMDDRKEEKKRDRKGKDVQGLDATLL